MKLTLVRHGEIDDNLKKIWPLDETPLNKNGIKQSAKLAERLKVREFDHIYCSPLLRAAETAKLALQYHFPYDLLLDQRLSDLDVGAFKGQPAHSFNYLEDFEKVPPHGESVNQLFARVSDFYQELVKSHAHENDLVIFSHSTPIRILTGLALGLSSLECIYQGLKRPDNTAVTELIVSPGGIHSGTVCLNCTKHLE